MKLIDPLCNSSGVTALRAFRDVKFESVSESKQVPLWLEVAADYSSIWKCNHIVCELCCFNISDSEYKRCPLCRSDILHTVTTDIPISLVSETIEYLDTLKAHELKLIYLLETLEMR